MQVVYPDGPAHFEHCWFQFADRQSQSARDSVLKCSAVRLFHFQDHRLHMFSWNVFEAGGQPSGIVSASLDPKVLMIAP